MVEFEINIEKKYLYVLGLFVLILVGAGLIYGYQPTGIATPVSLGHTSNEMTFVENSVPVTSLSGTIPVNTFSGNILSSNVDFSSGISGDVVVSGRLRTSATISSDDGTTLATRGYVESLM